MEKAEGSGFEFQSFWNLGQLRQKQLEGQQQWLQILGTDQSGQVGQGSGGWKSSRSLQAAATHPWPHPLGLLLHCRPQSLRLLCWAHISLPSPAQVWPWSFGSGQPLPGDQMMDSFLRVSILERGASPLMWHPWLRSHLLFHSRPASSSGLLCLRVLSTGSSFRIVLKHWPVSVLQSSRPPAGRGTVVRKLSWAQGSICSPDYKLLDVRDHESGGLSGAGPRHLDLSCFWCK